jgi:hypothetical protein
MRRALIILFCAVSLGACGEDEPAVEATSTPAVTTQATETPTETAVASDCRAGGWDIVISGGTGISCEQAKKIQAAALDDKELPEGWTCEIAACTKVSDDGTVVDFVWKARQE